MRAVVRRAALAGGSALLTAAAVLGTLCLLVTVVAPLLGVRPLVFLSGSMSPTIPAGSLALARTVDASAIEVNDIVTVPSNDTYLTHRVVEVTHTPGRATLLLRGDGNKDVDATVYEVRSAPRTEIWVPVAGTVIAWFSRAPGVYVLALWVAVVLSTVRRLRRPPDQGPTGPGSRTGRPKGVLVAGRVLGWARQSRRPVSRRDHRLVGTAAMVSLVVAVPAPALASWADTVSVTGTTMATVTPTAPVASCGTVTTPAVTVNWTAMPGATGYRLRYGDMGNPTVEDVSASTTSKTFANRVDGRFAVRTRYGGTWISAESNELRYDSTGQGSCAG